MFYSHILLTKKGPLAKVWLAAHWDRKITKAQVFETDLHQSIEAITGSQVRLSLRTSGHLLLGVVKLHNRKARYLLTDCNVAYTGIRMAYRPQAEITDDHVTCLPSAVTMAPINLEIAAMMMEGDMFINFDEAMFQARVEDITMPEEVMGNFSNMNDDDFGAGLCFGNEVMRAGESMETGDGLDLTGAENAPAELEGPTEPPRPNEDGPGVEPRAPGNEQDSLRRSLQRKCLLSPDKGPDLGASNFEFEVDPDISNPGQNVTVNLFSTMATPAHPAVEDVEMVDLSERNKPEDRSVVAEATDVLVLQPIDATQIGTVRKARRKRRLVVDEAKSLTSESMKKNFSNTSDILRDLDLAPPTKRLMNWRVFTCEKMMEMPVRFIHSKKLLDAFKTGLSLIGANRNEARDRRAAAAVADILNEPLVIATQEPDTPPVELIPEAADDRSASSEVARGSGMAPSAAADLSRDVVEVPDTMEHSFLPHNFDDPPSLPDLDLEHQLTRSLTKENRSKKSLLSEVGGFATPRRKEALRPSTAGNVAPERIAQVGGIAKTPPRARRFGESLAKRVLTQAMLTPRNNSSMGDDSLVLPPLDPQSPGGFETPRRNIAFDVTSTFSPLGTVPTRSQEYFVPEREPIQKEDRQKELLEVIRISVRPGNSTFRLALQELESKSGRPTTRRRVASTFHALLELKKKGKVEIRQSVPYGEIEVTAVP